MALSGVLTLETPGASIAGGPPLDDAVGYGHWRVARRLVERGARVEKLWHAAALGIMSVEVRQRLLAMTPAREWFVTLRIQVARAGVGFALLLGVLGSVMTFVPGYQVEWFGVASAAALSGVLSPTRRMRSPCPGIGGLPRSDWRGTGIFRGDGIESSSGTGPKSPIPR